MSFSVWATLRITVAKIPLDAEQGVEFFLQFVSTAFLIIQLCLEFAGLGIRLFCPFRIFTG